MASGPCRLLIGVILPENKAKPRQREGKKWRERIYQK
jgi:hypothetical protein